MMTQLRVFFRKCRTCGVTPQFVSSSSFRFLKALREQSVEGAILVHPGKVNIRLMGLPDIILVVIAYLLMKDNSISSWI